MKLPKHRLHKNGVSAILGGEKISITAYTPDGDESNLVIPEILYLFRVVPRLIEINKKLGFKLENLSGRYSSCLNGRDEDKEEFFYNTDLYKDESVALGSLKDKGSICFDYANYPGTEEKTFVDRVQYRTSCLEKNLDSNEDPASYVKISKKDHQIGFGAFA